MISYCRPWSGLTGKVKRKRYSSECKSRVALEAIRGEQMLLERASKHSVHQAIKGMAAICVTGSPTGRCLFTTEPPPPCLSQDREKATGKETEMREGAATGRGSAQGSGRAR